MATAKKTAAPAAKPAAKTAAKPAAKTVAKAAPAPEPEPEAAEEGEVVIEVGCTIKFLGYGPEVPETDQVLVADQEYVVSDITDDGVPVVEFENPDFDPKKKEDDAKNPRMLECEVLMEELEFVSGPAEETAAEEAVEEPAPAAKPAAKTAKAAAPAPAAKTAAKTPAKTAAKTPAKTAAKAPKAEAEPEPEVDPDDMDELENEDAEVLALVQGSEDLVATAQELEQNVASTEYQLGGILFHIRKDKVHRTMAGEDGKPIAEYSEKGGFAKFLSDFFNLDYRKAMNLIEIYVCFNKAGIEDASGQVSTMGWTKASKIAKHLLDEGANTAELIELASTHSVSDLVTVLKETVSVGGTPGTAKKRITVKLRYLEEEGNAIMTTLETAKAQLNLKTVEEALAHIVTDWAATNAGGTATAASAPRQTAAAKTAGAKPVAKTVAKTAAKA